MSLGEGDLYSIYLFRFTQGQSEAWSGKGNESAPPPNTCTHRRFRGSLDTLHGFKSRPWVERGGALTTQTPATPTSIGASFTAELQNSASELAVMANAYFSRSGDRGRKIVAGSRPA